MTSKQVRVAILFWRLGPYHHARLSAAGRLMEVFGVEACGMEDIYAWQKVVGADSFKRITLNEREICSRNWRKELSLKMWRTLDEIKPQVVVVPGWSLPDALSGLSWCAKTGTPAVMMSESTEWDESRTAWKEWIKQRLVRTCSAALAGGTPHRDYLRKLGVPAARIFLGYDVVDNDYFAGKAEESRQRKVEIRKKLGLPERFFLASARFIEKKNLPRLIKAYARYRKNAEKRKTEIAKSEIWDLVLLGDGPLRAAVLHLRSELGLEASVHLPGFKQYEELPAYYGLADAFIHASTVEQWGLVVNEAMASGLPVLVSNRCGCARDLVQEGVNGFTFDPCNIEELAGLMLKVSASNFPLSQFGLMSREIISQWGPNRFARGLQSAADIALESGTVMQRFLNRLLIGRCLYWSTMVPQSSSQTK